MILPILFSLFSFIQFANASLITRVDNKNIEYIYLTNYSINEVFSLSGLKLDKYELVGFVSSLNKLSHFPIDFSNIVEKSKKREKADSLYNSFMSLLYEGDESIDNYFTTINDMLHDFSEYCKSYCLDVMFSLEKQRIFSLVAKDFAKDLPQVKENNIPLNTNSFKKSTAFFFALGSAFVSGDLVAPVSVLLSDASQEVPVRNALEPDMLFDYSKVYCINSFSLFFDFVSDKQSDKQSNKQSDDKQSDKQRDDKQKATIYGDKIPYHYFLEFLTRIQDALNKELVKDLDIDLNKDLVKDNAWQQLEALKLVIIKLEQIIVFEIYDKLTNMVETSTAFPKIKNYISKKVSELVILKQGLVKDFPILKADVSAAARLSIVKRELDLIKHTQHLSSIAAISEQRVSKNVLLDELNENEFTTWATLYVYGPLKRTTSMIVRAAMALPEGVAVGGLQGVYDFLLSLFNIFSFNPVTSVFITIGGLAVIYSSVSTFVSWLFFPFLFLKRQCCTGC